MMEVKMPNMVARKNKKVSMTTLPDDAMLRHTRCSAPGVVNDGRSSSACAKAFSPTEQFPAKGRKNSGKEKPNHQALRNSPSLERMQRMKRWTTRPMA
jgi:hypothetical protein